MYFVSVVRFSSDRFVADFCEWFKASSRYTWVLTKILVFARYHSDDDRVRLSVKDFWAISVLSGAFIYRKKKQFCLNAHNKRNPFFIILISIVKLPNVQFDRLFSVTLQQ